MLIDFLFSFYTVTSPLVYKELGLDSIPQRNTKLTILYITISGWIVWTLNIMNQPLEMSPKLLSQQIRKRYYKILETSVTVQCLLPPSNGPHPPIF